MTAMNRQALTPEDRRRVEGLLAGDPEPTAEIQRWIDVVIAHRAWRLNRSEDLAQEVLLRVLRVLGENRFEARSSLKTFVQLIAKYTCLDAVRSERRSLLVSVEDFEELDAPSGDNPERELEEKELRRLCYTVLDLLPEGCRSLLCRVGLEDDGYDILASEHEVAVGTIKSRVARCRERARAIRFRLTNSPWRRGAEA